MNAEEFVGAIRKYVLQSAVESTLDNLIIPPGRQPAADLVEISERYLAMSDSERELIRRVVERAAKHAVFGFLVALDGDRKLADNEPNAYFELTRVDGDSRTVLSGPAGSILHELF